MDDAEIRQLMSAVHICIQNLHDEVEELHKEIKAITDMVNKELLPVVYESSLE